MIIYKKSGKLRQGSTGLDGMIDQPKDILNVLRKLFPYCALLHHGNFL